MILTAIAVTTLAGVTKVRDGDRVTVIRPLEDGLTYIVETPYGKERWRDRDLYYLALHGETCRVVKSFGTEVQLYVPLMDQVYWFVVE